MLCDCHCIVSELNKGSLGNGSFEKVHVLEILESSLQSLRNGKAA